MIKTFVVMLSTDSNLTPSMLAEKVATLGGVEFKETCYGLLLEGEESDLERVLSELRRMDPNKVFYKIRGYRIGDERICRAKRGGGPRPGYHMLSVEREALKNVSKALEEESKEEAEGRSLGSQIKEKPKVKLSADEMRKVIEEESGEGKGQDAA